MHKQAVNIQSLIQENSRLDIKFLSYRKKGKEEMVEVLEFYFQFLNNKFHIPEFDLLLFPI
ncbi:hypothetical protein [Methanosarcina sp.]|uniref:hypothetical protein n=1 Tax=Methanosarcina sp. TaxID=2213 RepID=UPI0029887F1D|nr:hypothetical protein [Methanosarcina sp.]MDW5548848.1 hypothetical protein [Methanosarcina sp.]MDW5553761.1 hypothetical protein [Methanosarcina sp.]